MNLYKVTTLNDVALDISKPVFFDTETDGLYGRIELAQFMQEGWEQVILVRRPDPLILATMLDNVVCHNAHYDITTIQQCTSSRWCPDSLEDTFLAARLVFFDSESFSLDSVIHRVIGHDPYETAGLDKKLLQKSNWSAPVLSTDQLLYAALDVWHMPEVYNAIKHIFSDQSYILDKSTLRTCLDFQWNGMPIDKEQLYNTWTDVEERLAKINMPINANSWQQVRQWLDVDKSDDLYLATLELKGGDERAGKVRQVRKLKKQLSFLAKYDIDEQTLIGKFKPSARSGRLTSNDYNLQQVPRSLKQIFGTGPDRVLIYSDYAQVELRTICAILGVRKMEEMFRAGEDLHGYVASVLFGEDYTKKDRQVTKQYNFNLLYGGSVNMVLGILLKYGFHIEERLANRHKTKWLNLFGEINKWQQEQIAAWRNGRTASTPMGRQYKGKLMTDQMNIMNQGAGAEVAKLALHYFYPWLKKQKDIKLVNFIHDSFIIDCPNDPELYKKVSIKLAECMQLAWFELSKTFKVKDLPMPVDVKVGHNWGELEDDKYVWHYELEPCAMYKEANNATV